MQGRYKVLHFSFIKISNATVSSKQNFTEKYYCLMKNLYFVFRLFFCTSNKCFSHFNVQKLLSKLSYFVLLSYTHLTLIRLGFLRVFFLGGGNQFDSPLPVYISRRTYLISIYFIQLLNNLFKVCWKWKHVDIICYKLMSLVSL